MTAKRTAKSLEEIVQNMGETIKKQQHEIERLTAAREVENLVNLYTFKLQANQFDDIPELFALDKPDVSVEILYLGVYVGAAGIKKMYLDIHRNYIKPVSPGGMFVDWNCNPVVEVAGDGQTAKGLWYSMYYTAGRTNGGGYDGAGINCQKRYFDFIKENGKWKIWHYHAYAVFKCDFYKSWIDMKPEEKAPVFANPLPERLRPDKPCTYHNPYSKNFVIEYVPRAPEPYDTWDKS